MAAIGTEGRGLGKTGRRGRRGNGVSWETDGHNRRIAGGKINAGQKGMREGKMRTSAYLLCSLRQIYSDAFGLDRENKRGV